MRKQPALGTALVIVATTLPILLVACSASGHPTTLPPTSTLVTLAPTIAGSAPLETTTGPYQNATSLLNGICFEALLSMAGQTWTLTSQNDLEAFYAAVEELEICVSPIVPLSHDFTDTVILVTIAQATGCDAAFHVSPLVEIESQNWRLPVDLEIVPGCDYELVEPLAVAAPRPPANVTITVDMSRPD